MVSFGGSRTRPGVYVVACQRLSHRRLAIVLVWSLLLVPLSFSLALSAATCVPPVSLPALPSAPCCAPHCLLSTASQVAEVGPQIDPVEEAKACVLEPGGHAAFRSRSNSNMLIHPARPQADPVDRDRRRRESGRAGALHGGRRGGGRAEGHRHDNGVRLGHCGGRCDRARA